MTDKNLKQDAYLICFEKGHTFEGESIIKYKNPDTHWFKRCSRCNLYIMHTPRGNAVFNEKDAFAAKNAIKDIENVSMKGENHDSEADL